jgi:hypothetical protein
LGAGSAPAFGRRRSPTGKAGPSGSTDAVGRRRDRALRGDGSAPGQSPEAAAPYLRARRRASGSRGEPKRPSGRAGEPPSALRGAGPCALRDAGGEYRHRGRAWEQAQGSNEQLADGNVGKVQRTSQWSKALRSSERRKAWTSARGNTGGTKPEPGNDGERASGRGDAPRPAAKGKAPKGRAL